MNAEDIVIGQEYEYLGQWVKAIRVFSQANWGKVIIETRLGSRITVSATELSPKQ